jgi:hypothetical protein
MKEGVSRSLETLADVGGKVQEEAVRAGYGPDGAGRRRAAAGRLGGRLPVRSREIVEEMRATPPRTPRRSATRWRTASVASRKLAQSGQA